MCFFDCCLVLCRLILFLLRVGGEASPGVVLGRSFLDLMPSDFVFRPLGARSGPRVPWTYSIALHRFVWAVQLGVGLGNDSQLECCRAALAVWIRKVDISVTGSKSGAPVSSADEEMLDWLVVFVRKGWTPKEFLIWFFPVFFYFLFHMISDSAEEV